MTIEIRGKIGANAKQIPYLKSEFGYCILKIKSMFIFSSVAEIIEEASIWNHWIYRTFIFKNILQNWAFTNALYFGNLLKSETAHVPSISNNEIILKGLFSQ